LTGFGDQFRIDSPRDERTKHCLGSSLNVLRQACPGPYPITSHVIGRAGGGAGSDLGVAQQAVLFPPFTGSEELPRPARHHKKSRRTFRWDGVTFQVSEKLWSECLAADAKALSLMNYSKEVVAELDKMAAKAKGSA